MAAVAASAVLVFSSLLFLAAQDISLEGGGSVPEESVLRVMEILVGAPPAGILWQALAVGGSCLWRSGSAGAAEEGVLRVWRVGGQLRSAPA